MISINDTIFFQVVQWWNLFSISKHERFWICFGPDILWRCSRHHQRGFEKHRLAKERRVSLLYKVFSLCKFSFLFCTYLTYEQHTTTTAVCNCLVFLEFFVSETDNSNNNSVCLAYSLFLLQRHIWSFFPSRGRLRRTCPQTELNKLRQWGKLTKWLSNLINFTY